MKLILASKSPRRREILSMLGLQITVLALDTDEYGDRRELTPEELVMGLSCRKVRAAWNSLTEAAQKDSVVLSADTVVVYDGEILEKPVDDDDARRMLSLLSGRKHAVYTGIAAICHGQLAIDVQCTAVTFRQLTQKEIDDYVASGEPMDKAGAYAVQGRGALFVERIDGDYFNVVGLPAARADDMFRHSYGFGLLDLT